MATVAVVAIIALWAGLSVANLRSPPSPQIAAEVEPAQEFANAEKAPISTTVSTTTTTAPPVPLRSARLAFTGDTLAHRGVVRQARTYAGAETGYDFSPMFQLVAPYLGAADVAICHLETPLSPDNTNLSGYPTFNVPREIADALVDAGYDGCSTASNHSLDRRSDGVTGTLDILDEAGLQHSGMARSIEERTEPTLYDAAGITMAHLSYTYGFNGFSTPADEPWRANLIDPDIIVADAAAAKDGGAEFVVVSLHWGTEYRHDPDEQQLAVADALTGRTEIDLIIGHHAHVVQPIEIRNGTPVVFGLGNFLSNQSAICCAAGSQDGAIVEVEISEVERADRTTPATFETAISVVETWVDRSDFTIVPVADALADPELAGVNVDVLTRSLERTRSVMSGE